jgi:predicted transcriptional regulator
MVTSRLPHELIVKLDRAASDVRRSRSWIIKEALETYLADKADTPGDLMKFAGAGALLSTRRTPEEVEAEIRWLRSDG